MSELKSNDVLIPDKFFSTNFCDVCLLILQFVKLSIWSLFMLPYKSALGSSPEDRA
mgnify:FL=1